MLTPSNHQNGNTPIKSDHQHDAQTRALEGSRSRWWQLLILGCLIAGLLLRCVNLGDKVYWYDEAFTLLRISGHTEAEAVQALTSQQADPLDAQLDAQLTNSPRLFDPTAFQPYQQLNPDRGVGDTIRGLALEEPQHTPLYYGLARLWAGWFGDSIAAVRSLSVLASVLALPAMAWLCWELFRSSSAAGLGTAILAVSPFQVVYAQEARPTALWTTTILIASAALLQAIRKPNQTAWLIYGIALVTSFYSYLFSGFVAIAHTIYVLWTERLQLTKTLLFFVMVLSASVLLFSPWLLIIATNSTQLNTVTNWVTVDHQFTLLSLMQIWAYHLILPFVDSGELVLPLALRILDDLIRWCIRLLLIYSVWRLWRQESLRVWLFVFLLAGVPVLMLTLPDLLSGGQRSTIPRYLVPVYLGFQLAVVYGLSQQWSHHNVRQWQKRIWATLTVLVLTVGLVSSVVISQSESWWNKVHNTNVPRLAQTINQTERPLIISDAEISDLFALSYYLEPKVRLLLRPQCYACQVTDRSLVDSPYLPSLPSGFSDVFLYHPRPSATWLNRLQQAPYSVKPLSEGFNQWFWQIEQSQ
ncbi:MAG: hypothetical protein HC827_01285 [Cyanobacteria bacterium RM1_2_2]|nr:hypothetical protein [Cyanobacteria bacterium RM1_2_2]